MTGGSRQKKDAGIFSRSREIEELHEWAQSREKLLSSLKDQRDALIQKQTGDAQNLEKITESLRQNETAFLNNQNQTRHLQEQKARDLEHRQDLDRESNRLKEQLEQARSAVAACAEELGQAQTAIGTQKETLEQYQEKQAKRRLAREQQVQELSQNRMRLTQTRTEYKNTEENMERARQNVQMRNQTAREKQTESRACRENAGQLETQKESLQKEQDEARRRQQEAQSRLTDLGLERKTKNECLAQWEAQRSERQQTLARLGQEILKTELSAEKSQEELKRIREELWENQQITWQAALQFPARPEPTGRLREEAAQYRTQMKELGNVNLGAVEEYQKAAERQELLTKQRTDILETEEKLTGVIENLTRQMEERFVSQMAVLSQNFDKVFREMFGGGRAQLCLGEGAALEAGIEVVAQPPGKTLQNMNLLSGGERTLTAIAILFAILQEKPSPFCILDETESALDDANVRRYAAYLKKISRSTQLIVISHRKGTMEAGDVLYGVTMQEQGVSKLVSVSMADAK